MEQAQKKENQEIAALNLLVKAAENYLATLDELARGPTTAHLQNAITILAKVITSSQTVDADEATPAERSKK